MPIRPFRPLGLILVCLMASAAVARAETFRARYDAFLFGFPIGKAEVTSRFESGRFEIEGSFGSAGLARLFDPADGIARANGRVTGNDVVQHSYLLSYKSGKKHQKTAIRFAGGRVADTENKPPLKKHRKNWVPLSEGDLAGVADPLTALLVPTDNAKEVCRRTLKVYDGEMRADLVLTPATKWESLDSGTVTCRARFVPVAGYRKNRSAIEFLRDKAKILVAFAPVGGTGLQSPVEATIGTQIGTVHIRARPLKAE